MHPSLLQFFTGRVPWARAWVELPWRARIQRGTLRLRRSEGLSNHPMVVNRTSPLAFCRSTGFTVGSI
jgi:hypothetical protein